MYNIHLNLADWTSQTSHLETSWNYPPCPSFCSGKPITPNWPRSFQTNQTSSHETSCLEPPNTNRPTPNLTGRRGVSLVNKRANCAIFTPCGSNVPSMGCRKTWCFLPKLLIRGSHQEKPRRRSLLTLLYNWGSNVWFLTHWLFGIYNNI